MRVLIKANEMFQNRVDGFKRQFLIQKLKKYQNLVL